MIRRVLFVLLALAIAAVVTWYVNRKLDERFPKAAA